MRPSDFLRQLAGADRETWTRNRQRGAPNSTPLGVEALKRVRRRRTRIFMSREFIKGIVFPAAMERTSASSRGGQRVVGAQEAWEAHIVEVSYRAGPLLVVAASKAVPRW
jgi:hypothetical protein